MILALAAPLVLFAAAMVVLFLSEREAAREARAFQRSARHAARARHPSARWAELDGMDRDLDRKYATQFQQVDEENEAIRGWNP